MKMPTMHLKVVQFVTHGRSKAVFDLFCGIILRDLQKVFDMVN